MTQTLSASPLLNFGERIFSWDGGGILGAMSSSLAQKLECQYPSLTGQTDVFAGASTGSIIALALAYGLSLAEVVQLYQVDGPDIFYRPWWRPVSTGAGLWAPKYSNDNLHSILVKTFGSARLKDLKKRVVVPATCIKTWTVHVFTNETDPDALVVDVAMASSAAPVYFPSYNGYVDGGLSANNPGAVALSLCPNIENALILSMGTGTFDAGVSDPNVNWGLAQWAPKLMSMTLQAGITTAIRECQDQIGKRFFRIDHNFGSMGIDMDDTDAIPDLVAAGQNTDTTQVLQWLSDNVW